MVVAVMVVKLENAVVAVAAMDVVLIQIIVAHQANFLKKTTPLLPISFVWKGWLSSSCSYDFSQFNNHLVGELYC